MSDTGRESLRAWARVDMRDFSHFSERFSVLSIPAGQHVVEPGREYAYMLFCVSGLLRFYSLNADGSEWNKGFLIDGEMTGALLSESWPAPYGIQALEDSTLLAAPVGAIRDCCERSDALRRRMEAFVAAMLEEKAARSRSLQALDATERYREFLARHAGLATRLTQAHIASFLGMTEVTLSRVKKRLLDVGDMPINI